MTTAVATESFVVNETTQKILKNFASISDSVLLRQGRTQRTLTQGKTVFANAEFPNDWPRETGIYALRAFLGDLSLFDKPTVEFKEDHMVISSVGAPRSRTFYRYSDPSTIMTIPEKTFPTQNPAVEFTLPEYDLKQLKSHMSQLDLASVTVIVKNDNVIVQASNPKNSSAHGYRLEISKTEVKVREGFTRSIPFLVENLAFLMDGTYTVSLDEWRYGYFVNRNIPIAYFVTESLEK